jgi:hypothetical protein
MASLISKNISFLETSKLLSLEQGNAFIFYYIPQKFRVILKKELMNYKLLTLYKAKRKT